VSLKSLSLRCQEGFTTVTLMGVLMAGGLMVAAGFAAVDPDISQSRKDQDYKQTYAAAEAGLNYYLYHLGQDNNLYTKCQDVPKPNTTENNPITQTWSTPPADGFRKLPGESAEYNIELLPAKGYTACVKGKQETMIDPATGSFRVRANGRIKKPNGQTIKRSVIATLRRKSFIDFLYFTNFETADPATYSTPASQDWASANCVAYRPARSTSCTEIRFVDNDAVRGPFHSNDDILTCDRPDFGRTKNDAIELGGKSPGWTPICGTETPNFLGTRVWPGGTLPMPPTNKELQAIADPAYRFNGRTTITLQNNSMQITNAAFGTKTMSLPANGVIYVGSLGCPVGYARKQEYNNPASCGDVWIKGTYSQDLTIAAANDIIVTDDLLRDTGATNGAGLLMGLVADNFVRVYHPVRNWRNNNTDCDNNGGPGTINIQSAILALNHSFIVDNYYCGSPTGTLTVDGAIAQQFRGPVGTGSSSSIATGYLKNYIYNDRLRYREPPFFIDPVQSAWQIVRQNEQIPAH
jgi:hypothetical protein